MANQTLDTFVRDALNRGEQRDRIASALVSALAGVASLRLGRRFTLRTAIIATTVVAGLLGMAVIL